MISPEHSLGSRAGLKALNVICWGLLLMLAVTVGTLVWSHVKGGEGFDFVYFYGAGRLAAERPPTRLYDYVAQLEVFNSVCPAQKQHYGPSPYPPFVGLFFANFSRMPFPLAYFLWMAISLTLYVTGVRAVLKALMPCEPLEASLLLCLALAFPPFLLYNLVNGQLSSVAVFCVGFAIYQEYRERPFAAGLFLSLLAYKPTLLLVIVPMLCLTRRFKVLLGFATGAFALAAVSTVLAGPQIWPAYARLIEAFRKLSAGDTSSGIKGGLRHWQFVDLNALSYAIPGARSQLGSMIWAAILLSVAAWVAVLFWRSAKEERSAQYLAWAIALTWTLLANLYVPIYDAALAVIPILLTIGALEDLRWRNALHWASGLAILVFAVSWVTRAIAERYGLQLLTLVLFFWGIAQASFLQQSLRSTKSREERKATFTSG